MVSVKVVNSNLFSDAELKEKRYYGQGHRRQKNLWLREKNWGLREKLKEFILEEDGQGSSCIQI